jgi:hypothetical protein
MFNNWLSGRKKNPDLQGLLISIMKILMISGAKPSTW